jgi:hypothetical protein
VYRFRRSVPDAGDHEASSNDAFKMLREVR